MPVATAPPPMVAAAPVPAPAAAAPAAAPAAPANAEPAADADEGLIAIESPMVGTFYLAPSPDKPPFVSPGDTVNPDSVVCLIEAMKIYNEIKAEQSGTVVRVLVKNEEAVEFGQPIMMIKPA